MKRSPRATKPATAMLGRPKDAIKRARIVRAASKLFFKSGYVLTSMDAIASMANVSKLTIYSHFDDKDDLYKEVVRQRCETKAMPSSFLARADEPIDTALFSIGESMCKLLFSADSLRLHRIMQAEATHHPRVSRIYYEGGPLRVREAFGDLLRVWHRQGKISIPDITRATEQFFSLLKGEMMMKMIMLSSPSPSPKEIKKHVQATVSFFLAAYTPRHTKGA